MTLLMHSAARPGAHNARTSSAGLVACFIERENKGLSCLESFFSQDDFSKQHQELSFWGLGVAKEERMGDKIDEWQIDGFHSSAEEKNKRCTHFRKKKLWKETCDWCGCFIRHTDYTVFSLKERYWLWGVVCRETAINKLKKKLTIMKVCCVAFKLNYSVLPFCFISTRVFLSWWIKGTTCDVTTGCCKGLNIESLTYNNDANHSLAQLGRSTDQSNETYLSKLTMKSYIRIHIPFSAALTEMPHLNAELREREKMSLDSAAEILIPLS